MNTKESLIKEVQALAKKLGRTPLMKEFPEVRRIYSSFNGWNELLG